MTGNAAIRCNVVYLFLITVEVIFEEVASAILSDRPKECDGLCVSF